MPGKASATAYPIQGLVKYHGLRDPVRRIPYHDSISVCTGPIHSHTTVEVQERSGPVDSVSIDTMEATGRPLARVVAVLDEVRRRAGSRATCRVVSANDFPQFVGLGSSSSGFAALTVAAAAAYGVAASPEELSEIARLGAGSASRSVTGGVSEWVVDGERSYARCLLPPDGLDWEIVVPLVRHEEPTETVHQEVVTSPFFGARVDSIEATLRDARQACAEVDLEALWACGEKDTLALHAVTMTGRHGHLTWQPATVAVIHAVRRLRKQGLPVWFSIDTGATAYLNTPARHAGAVAEAMVGIPGVAEVLRLRPAGPATLVDEHLF